MPETMEHAIVPQRNLRTWADAPKEEEIREKIINFFFRFGSFADERNGYKELSPLLVGTIAKETDLPDSMVLTASLDFLTKANKFSKSLSLGLTSWGSGEKSKLLQARFHLRRAYRIAPVFNYSRAVANLEILHGLFKRNFYWPHITTQLALVIFVTDKNDATIQNSEFILQKNLRAFCACSAYAFHMSRKRLKIGKMGRVGSSPLE